MKKYLGCLVLSLMLFPGVQPVFAQSNLEYRVLTQEIQSLKRGQAELKQDIQELKKLVQNIKQAPAAPGAPEFKEAMINVKGAPIKGEKTAKLVLIEFSDYQ